MDEWMFFIELECVTFLGLKNIFFSLSVSHPELGQHGSGLGDPAGPL